MENKFSTVVSKIYKTPKFLHSFLLTRLFSSQVKYAATSGIKITMVTTNETRLYIENKKAVRNHIGGVHAIAVALLAESATGIVFGFNVPDTKVPLLKSMKIDYQRRMQGNLTAIANLTDKQISSIEQDEKGSMFVPVIIEDESDESPIECLMEWAWVTKRRVNNA